MKLIKLAAPVTALALLTGACSATKATSKPPSDPIPTVSPAGGPALTRVWQVPRTVAKLDYVNPYDSPVAGNTVVALDPKRNDGFVFIDGTTGKITGRVNGVTSPARVQVSAANDERGRPLVALTRTDGSVKAWEWVYDPTGRLIWKSPGHFA